ncbi:MAG: DNA polymerase III subunit alpha, partial [Clostridia bacterium]|nr:DNA polymerase III subunit alpha [Clostridia bacterium]
EGFASYAFNKPHAASYAYVSYQTAWLKCHYPREFMAALLTSVLDNTNKVAEYIAECQRLGIQVLPPSINENESGFTVSGKHIRFGLLAGRNIGRSFLDQMIRQRQKRRFTGFYDFCDRMYGKELNRRALESLIKIGAMDGLGYNRRQMMLHMDTILDDLDATRRRNLEGQMSLFGTADEDGGASYEIPPMDEYPIRDMLAMEKEMAGMYLSGHPMAQYQKIAESIGAVPISKILACAHSEEGEVDAAYRDGDRLTVLAIVQSVKTKITKNNQTMACVTLEDMYGAIEMLVFPKSLETYSALLQEGRVLEVVGKLSLREEEDAKLLCDYVGDGTDEAALHSRNAAGANRHNFPRNDLPAPPPMQEPAPGPSEVVTSVKPAAKSSRNGLYLRTENLSCEAFQRARRVMAVFDGNTPVYVYCTDTGKLSLAARTGWVYMNEPMLQELRRILGDKNVAVRD